jgi:hypothetical protein
MSKLWTQILIERSLLKLFAGLVMLFFAGRSIAPLFFADF